jgi:hypothetical protein
VQYLNTTSDDPDPAAADGKESSERPSPSVAKTEVESAEKKKE